METIQSPGQQVPSFLVPPHSKAFLFSVVCCLVVCAIHGRAKIYLKRLSQRDLPAITSFSSATAGLGLARRGRTKNFRRFPPSFRTNETSHLVFPTEEKVSFLILLLLFSRSPSLIDVWNDLARGKHSRDDRKNVPNPWPVRVHEMAGEWSDAEGERIGTREGGAVYACNSPSGALCLSLCLGGNCCRLEEGDRVP